MNETACKFDQQVPEGLGVNDDATLIGNNTILPSMSPPTLPVLSDEQLLCGLLKKKIIDLVLTDKPTWHLPAL